MHGSILDEIVPEHACRVFQDTDEDTNIRRIVLDGRTRVAVLYAKQLPQLTESREAPITLLGDESVVRVCDGRE